MRLLSLDAVAGIFSSARRPEGKACNHGGPSWPCSMVHARGPSPSPTTQLSGAFPQRPSTARPSGSGAVGSPHDRCLSVASSAAPSINLTAYQDAFSVRSQRPPSRRRLVHLENVSRHSGVGGITAQQSGSLLESENSLTWSCGAASTASHQAPGHRNLTAYGREAYSNTPLPLSTASTTCATLREHILLQVPRRYCS